MTANDLRTGSLRLAQAVRLYYPATVSLIDPATVAASLPRRPGTAAVSAWFADHGADLVDARNKPAFYAIIRAYERRILGGP